MQSFRGGTREMNDSINAWADVARTFKAALVNQINETPDAGWRYLSEFTANNVLIPDQTRPTITGRVLESYNATNDGTSLKFTDELDFGTPAGAQLVRGVLVYEDVSGDPAQSEIYSYDDDTNYFPTSTLGGANRWGSAGPVNEILRWEPGVSTTACLAGALRDLQELADPWSPTGPYTFAARLILSTGTLTPDPDWETLQDMTDAGVLWAAVSADASIPAADRVAATWNLTGSLDRYQFAIDPASQLTWASVTAGQSIGGVVIYRNTGNDSTSRVWHFDAAFTPFVTSGGNVTYGSGAQQVVQFGQH